VFLTAMKSDANLVNPGMVVNNFHYGHVLIMEIMLKRSSHRRASSEVRLGGCPHFFTLVREGKLIQ